MSNKYEEEYIDDDLFYNKKDLTICDKTDYTLLSKKYNKIDITDIVENIFDIIKKCQLEMYIPIFDLPNFGYFQVNEYIKTLGIK
jgi:hypothetical protein